MKYKYTNIDTVGNKFYYDSFGGLLHREDGPAQEFIDGTKVYYLHGKLHREDGPAVEYSYGDFSWYVKGKQIN